MTRFAFYNLAYTTAFILHMKNKHKNLDRDSQLCFQETKKDTIIARLDNKGDLIKMDRKTENSINYLYGNASDFKNKPKAIAAQCGMWKHEH